MATKIPLRNKVDKKYTWNAESVYKSPKEWEAALLAVLNDIPKVKKFEGKLSEGSATLLKGYTAIEDLILRAQTIFMYAQFAYAVDTTDQSAGAMVGKAQGMYGQVAAAVSFLNPELLKIGRKKLNAWMKENKKLAVYGQAIDDLFRQQAHVRSGEVEEILGMLADPFGGPSTSTSMLVNADFKFAPAVDSKGKKYDVTQGNFYSTLLEHPDRKVRQSAFESYHDKHIEFKNTLATNLSTSISANVFNMRARKFNTTLSASLFNNNVPEEVFHNLIDTFKKNLPIWHRYFEIRRKALGLKEIQYFDMWHQSRKRRPHFPTRKPWT